MSIVIGLFVLMAAVTVDASDTTEAPKGADFGPLAPAALGKTCCPNGWLAYGGSCYWFARQYADRSTYEQARAACKARGASLMTPETLAEWDAVMEHAVTGQRTWIGLSVDLLEDAADTTGPLWDEQEGEREYVPMSYHTLPWLLKSPSRGAALAASCVGYYNALRNSASFTNFFSCDLPIYYVCKMPA